MAFKERTEPIILTKLRILNKRLDLTDEEKRYFSKLEKGYNGELQFDAMTEKLTSSCLILNDLLLEAERTTFQIDTLIIFASSVYLFEIKTNQGDYLYKSDSLVSTTGVSIKNPLDQINRNKLLLKKLLNQLGYNFTLNASVVFINPEFTLYHAHPELPFIFPTQIKRLFYHLNNQPGNVSSNHKKLANKLVSLHQTDSAFNKLPTYDYDGLKKGITCNECDSFSLEANHKYLVCRDCGHKELVEAAVIRTVEEFRLLFPERAIKTSIIKEWCAVIENSKRISRILSKHLNTVGSRKWTNYIIRSSKKIN